MSFTASNGRCVRGEAEDPSWYCGPCLSVYDPIAEEWVGVEISDVEREYQFALARKEFLDLHGIDESNET